MLSWIQARPESPGAVAPAAAPGGKGGGWPGLSGFRAEVEARAEAAEEAGGLGGLRGNEQTWMDDGCLWRYLCARRGRPEPAWRMLRESLLWRRRFRVEALLRPHGPEAALVRREGATGKLLVLHGVATAGRAVLLMRPRLENDRNGSGNLRFLVWSLERACARAERLVVVVDFEGYSLRNAPSLETSRETLRILQDHYPERLGAAVLVEAPTLFYVAYKALSPFIDSVTKSKIVFAKKKDMGTDPACTDIFDMAKLPKEYGGEAPLVFDESTYFDEEILPHYLKSTVIT